MAFVYSPKSVGEVRRHCGESERQNATPQVSNGDVTLFIALSTPEMHYQIAFAIISPVL
jgi:hypothetical protein